MEVCAVADRGYECCCYERTNAWYRTQPVTCWICRSDSHDVSRGLFDRVLDPLQTYLQLPQQCSHQIRDSILGVLQYRRQLFQQSSAADWNCEAVLEEE